MARHGSWEDFKQTNIDSVLSRVFDFSCFWVSCEGKEELETSEDYVFYANWAPVSEPGFLDFQISRFFILEIIIIQGNMFGKYVGEISMNKS